MVWRGAERKGGGQRWCWSGLNDAVGLRSFSRHWLKERRKVTGVDKQSQVFLCPGLAT